jgi:hypothetical protein
MSCRLRFFQVFSLCKDRHSQLRRRWKQEKENRMVAATDGLARKFAAYVDEPVLAAEPRKGFFVRFMEALMETRRGQARREIAKRAHLLDGSWRQLDL